MLVAYLVSENESTDITDIAQFYFFIQGLTEDFQIVQELQYVVPIKKGGDTVLSWIGNFFYKHEMPWGEKVVWYVMMGHSLWMVERMMMQEN